MAVATFLYGDCDKLLVYLCGMKHISILVLNNATLTSLDGTHQLFTRVNDFLKYYGQQPFYQIDLVGTTGETLLNDGLYTIKATKTIDEKLKTDLIIIPIICGDYSKTIDLNKAFTGWITAQYGNGAEIASLCVGSLFLASTGVLDGKNCAAHWAVRNDFQNMFPLVNVLDETIMTDENGIYTSGGTYSYLNLLLHIVEKHVGREISILASKMFEIDIDRKTQHQFSIFSGQKRHNDTEVLNAQDYIEKHTAEKIAVEELCAKYAVQRRTFERRFKKSTGNSVSEYIQRVKVETVKKQLETGRKTINEIVYEVGYNDLNAFRGVFKKYVGMSPVEYRKKYAK
jgi:transcriptional regulator GlxA family with amidase domain